MANAVAQNSSTRDVVKWTSGTLGVFSAVAVVALFILQHTTPLLSHTSAFIVYIPPGGTFALAVPVFFATFCKCGGQSASAERQSASVPLGETELKRRSTQADGHCLIHALCGKTSSHVSFGNHREIRQFYVTYLRQYAFLDQVKHDSVRSALETMLYYCLDPTPSNLVKERPRFVENITDAEVLEMLSEYEKLIMRDRLCREGKIELSDSERGVLRINLRDCLEDLKKRPEIWNAYLEMLAHSPRHYFYMEEISVFAQMTQTNIHVQISQGAATVDFPYEKEQVDDKPSFGYLDEIEEVYIHLNVKGKHYEARR